LLRGAMLLERAVQAERALHNLLENAPDVLLGVDARGRVMYANSEASRVFGQPIEALLGRLLLELVPTFPSRNITLGDGQALFPLPDVRIGERTFVPSVRVVPGDTAAKTTIALRDVTDRKHLERRRLDFYSIIAHDLRAPLQAIMLRTESILRGHRGQISSELLADVSTMERNVRAMVTLINDFLELARLEGTGLKIHDEPLDLGALATSALQDIRPLSDANGQALVLAALPEAVLVRGDRARLSQVFANLLGNAIKFTPRGGRIRVELARRSDSVRTSVCDNGPGIPSEVLPHVFERFKRMPAHQHIVGSGLGLTIVREVVEAHGGHVGVQSEEGTGSCFWFDLPVPRT
jgi:two-component system phosphate regulon sensor histidine kinase PhoR